MTTEGTYEEVLSNTIENKEEVNEEVKEEVKGDVKEEESIAKPIEKVALKKTPPCRAKLKDKVTCENCGKELSRHSYDYTHKKILDYNI